MKVKKIKMKKGCGVPTSVTVELTTREAAFLTKLVGGHNEASADAVMVEGGKLLGIYNDFTGYFFNRFWENGVEDIH